MQDSLEKQADTQFLGKLLNTMFNPTAFEKNIIPSTMSPKKRAFLHSAILAGSYGSLAYIVRKLNNLKERATLGISEVKELDPYAYTSGKYPTLSIDPDTSDIEEEKEIERKLLSNYNEMKSDKSAGDENIGGSIVGGVGDVFSSIATGDQDPAHLALATAAVFAATAGGWKLADYLEDIQRRERLQGSIDETKNKVDSLIHSEYRRVKGSPSQKIANSAGTPATNFLGGAKKGPIRANLSPSGFSQSLQTFWWLWATFAFALSYRAMKEFSDKKDPNRERIKSLRKLLNEKRKVHGSPVMLDVSDIPSQKDTTIADSSNKNPTIPSNTPAPNPPRPKLVSSGDVIPESPLPKELGVSEDEDIYSELMGT